MKTIKYIGMSLAAIMIAGGLQANAQDKCHTQAQRPAQEECQPTPTWLRNMRLRIDWQMNAPVSTGFADQISGWGMNFEWTYRLTPRWETGLFASFHTNHDYIGRETISLSPTESLTTDQARSLYQVPFGLTTSYALCRNHHFRPYIGVKLGALYSRNTTYTGMNGWYDKGWGFYASPEIGMEIMPFRHSDIGFHLSAFYSYGTNQGDYVVNQFQGINNLGFRLGIVF